jgi:FO synthase
VLQWMLHHPLDDLCQQAAALRDEAHPTAVTFSPKVFLPITRLCRDACGYCTFAQPPRAGVRAYMTAAEVLGVARRGAAAGCTEALLTLGDKPELLYPQARAELEQLGFASTIEYVAHICAVVMRETGLLPHVNAGVMSRGELTAVRHVSASQGLMLESTAAEVLEPGGAHDGCPDKEPDARLATIRDAGA